MAETYPQHTSWFKARQLGVHLIVVMFVAACWFSIVERRGKACQQMCYTGLQQQHRKQRHGYRPHTGTRVLLHGSSTISPDRRDAVKVLYNDMAQTLRSARRCNLLPSTQDNFVGRRYV